MTIDFKALGARAAAEGKDMTVAQAGGGGDYTPPPEGPCLVRFISYIELGKQKSVVKGVPQVKDTVLVGFELHGKNYPVHVADDGTKTPVRLSIETNLSLNEKAHFYKLFTRMNHTQAAKHMAELLGEGFKAQVVHDKWAGKDGKERITATLKAADGYTIQPARAERQNDEGEIEWVTLKVPAAVSPIRCFLWDYADMDQWNSLHIPGEYPERKNDKGEVIAKAKSKNVFQDKIKRAENFTSSPMYALLTAGGTKIDIPDAEDGEDALGNGGSQTGSTTGATGTGAGAAASSTTSPSEQVAKLAAAGDPLAGIC